MEPGFNIKGNKQKLQNLFHVKVDFVHFSKQNAQHIQINVKPV